MHPLAWIGINVTCIQHFDKILYALQCLNCRFDFSNLWSSFNVNCTISSLQLYMYTCMCCFSLTVFAYGATGAGKTHTMLGAGSESPGVIYLTMVELYQKISAMQSEKSCNVTVSYLEVSFSLGWVIPFLLEGSRLLLGSEATSSAHLGSWLFSKILCWKPHSKNDNGVVTSTQSYPSIDKLNSFICEKASLFQTLSDSTLLRQE